MFQLRELRVLFAQAHVVLTANLIHKLVIIHLHLICGFDYLAVTLWLNFDRSSMAWFQLQFQISLFLMQRKVAFGVARLS